MANEFLIAIANQLKEAIRISCDPASESAARLQAYQLHEEVKSNKDRCLPIGYMLYAEGTDFSVRLAGLRLMEYGINCLAGHFFMEQRGGGHRFSDSIQRRISRIQCALYCSDTGCVHNDHILHMGTAQNIGNCYLPESDKQRDPSMVAEFEDVILSHVAVEDLITVKSTTASTSTLPTTTTTAATTTTTTTAAATTTTTTAPEIQVLPPIQSDYGWKIRHQLNSSFCWSISLSSSKVVLSNACSDHFSVDDSSCLYHTESGLCITSSPTWPSHLVVESAQYCSKTCGLERRNAGTNLYAFFTTYIPFKTLCAQVLRGDVDPIENDDLIVGKCPAVLSSPSTAFLHGGF